MRTDSANLGNRSGNLVETHTTFQPRIFFFYFLVAALLVALVWGLANQQLFKTTTARESERIQNQRRILVPGPRGIIKDREGRVIVANTPRFAAVLYLDELRPEFRWEFIRVRKNFRETGDKDLPAAWQMERIARASVVQRYLDQANAIIGRKASLDSEALANHFRRDLLLPFTLINDLAPEEYARLIEKLPVVSPLQVYTSSVRTYPFNSAASHAIGSVRIDMDIEAEDFPGNELRTFRMKGSMGRDGLEKQYDAVLQGEPGGSIFLVDPSGYRIRQPLERRLPVQGKNLTCSLDMDLQVAAEEAIGDRRGAAVLMEVNTGEVLVLASKPDYDLNKFSPKLSSETSEEIEKDKAWMDLAVSGVYMPGSTFKLVTAIAGLRSGKLTPTSTYTTDGSYEVGGHAFRDHRGCMTGEVDFTAAIEHSVNTFFINYGLLIGANAIAEEARRFHLHERTGIDLPVETRKMYIGTDEWKRSRFHGEGWYAGDTANLSFGQGYLGVTPLQMACFMASLARGETQTRPLMLHQADHKPQRSAPIGISPEHYKALLEGMERVVISGTGRVFGKVPGLRIAAKTGTAQQKTKAGTIELAWYVGFAPADAPRVAWAVLIEADEPDQNYGGGTYAAPVATAMLTSWLKKQKIPAATAP